MLPAARYHHLVINDGDIRVPPDYLRRVMAPLADSTVGLVTALYRAIAGHTIGSKLEALSISDFAGSVLVSYQNQRAFHYGFGSTLAFLGKCWSRSAASRRLPTILPMTISSPPSSARPDTALFSRIWWSRLQCPTIRCTIFGITNCAGHAPSATPAPPGALGWGSSLECSGQPWRFSRRRARRGRGPCWHWPMGQGSRRCWLRRCFCHDHGTLHRLWLLPLRDLQAVLVWAAALQAEALCGAATASFSNTDAYGGFNLDGHSRLGPGGSARVPAHSVSVGPGCPAVFHGRCMRLVRRYGNIECLALRLHRPQFSSPATTCP